MLNTVDIRNENDIELAMRVQTDIKNPNGEFYTDLNGFQVCLLNYKTNVEVFLPSIKCSFADSEVRMHLTVAAIHSLLCGFDFRFRSARRYRSCPSRQTFTPCRQWLS